MTENERLADQIINELTRAVMMYFTSKWTAEQFLTKFKQIVKAANLQ